MTQTAARSRAIGAEYDEGLRAFMIGVYNRLGGSLLLTAIMAWIAANPLRPLLFTGAGEKLGLTALGWVVMLAPLALLLVMGFITKNSHTRSGSSFLLWAISALFGASMGTVLLRYTGISIGSTLAVTALSFGALSLFGYTTKRDLNGIGNFLFMALIGLIFATIISMFVPGMNLMISIAGILIFAGFIAYDTQKLKEFYAYGTGPDETAALQNMAALNLYLDFINMFQFILQLMGQKIGSDD